MSPNTSRGGSGTVAGVMAACAATLGVGLFWGFTVDDAWITARVAWRLANGLGYRFNASGAPTDAVTPLGWVFCLVPFAKHSVLDAFQAARLLGAFSWVLASAWFGFRLKRAGKNPFYAMVLFATPPLGAWASAGMETGCVVALSTLALGETWLATMAAGIVAAFRPEMIPFCAVLALRSNVSGKPSELRKFAPLALTLAFPIVVTVVRQFAFGRPMPLAALAKPSDLEHGLRYGLGVLLFLGPTWLWLGNGWKALTRSEFMVALSVAVHFAAILAVGGDWMPLWRLAVPVMPAALWVAACLHTRQKPTTNLAGLVVGLIGSVYVSYRVGLPARHVLEARLSLVDQAKPLLAGSRQVVALDVGWLGAATAGDIFDLAGVTDSRVAQLPGGHTTKKIPNSWFDSRQPDGLVLLSAEHQTAKRQWQDMTFARQVENRIKSMPYWQPCRLSGTIGLKYTTQTYVVVRCP